MEERWFAGNVAYTMAKYGMSMCVLGMAGEFRKKGVAVNALWPDNNRDCSDSQYCWRRRDDENLKKSRRLWQMRHMRFSVSLHVHVPETFIDEDVLLEAGVTDMEQYAVTPGEFLLHLISLSKMIKRSKDHDFSTDLMSHSSYDT